MFRKLGILFFSFLFFVPAFAEETQTPTDSESQFKVIPYGYFKLDAAMDDTITNNEDYPWWVVAGDRNNAKFTMHARQTRFGLNFLGLKAGSADVFGQIEVDLTNGGSDTKYLLGVRHAYMKLSWKHVSLLAGQTWDVISPLNPSTVNYIVLWNAGNIGFRRPQIRLTWNLPVHDWSIKTSVAALRSVGQDFSSLGASTDDGGVDSAMPVFQGRIGLHGKLAGKPTQFGISGHVGREVYGSLLDKQTTWSLNADIVIPITDWMNVKGEYFYGKNLDAYQGGIGQGLVAATNTAVKAQGGWGQIHLKSPCRSFEGNLGVGIDNPKASNLQTGDRDLNYVGFANVHYLLSKEVRVAFEYSYWKTKYVNATSSDNNRYQLAFIYNLPK